MKEGSRRLIWVLGVVLGIVGVSYGFVRACGARRQVVHVMAADALAVPFGQLVEAFERENPDVAVNATYEGSVMLLRMYLLHPSDVLALADHRLIEQVLHPNDADWLIQFATTELVIAHTQASRYVDKITSENWPDILLRPDVLVGHPDPSVDSCGYYTRLAWKLAEKDYGTRYPNLYERLAGKVSAKYQRLDAPSEMVLLESRAIDYAFVYACHAEQHHLPYTRLPEGANLGSVSKEREYAEVEVEVPDFRGKLVKMSGHTIYFGLTMPRDSRQRAPAERFVRFVLSSRGQQAMRGSGMVPLVPPLAPSWSTQMPRVLRELVGPLRAPAGASTAEATD